MYIMALLQLYALGASDVWLWAKRTDLDAVPFNLSAYNYCSFITGDGEIDTTIDGVIHHKSGIEFPFSVKREKAATKIQQSWRTKQRLLRKCN